MFLGCKYLQEIIFYPASMAAQLNNGNITLFPIDIFTECETIKTLTVPYNVTTIGSFAFDNCTSIKDITLSPQTSVINTGAFNNCNQLTDLRIS